MKKLILLAAALTIIASASFAQDSTDNRPVNRYRADSAATANPYDIRDMVKIKGTDLPPSLQKSLKDSRYQGWEQGTYYRSQKSDRYYIEMDRDGKKSGYVFGADGMLIPNTSEKKPK